MIEEECVIIHEKVKLFFWPKGKVIVRFDAQKNIDTFELEEAAKPQF